MATNRAVLLDQHHMDVPRRNGSMTEQQEKYDATYKFGNTTVHVVAPKQITPEKFDRVMKEFHNAGWSIINELIRKGKEV